MIKDISPLTRNKNLNMIDVRFNSIQHVPVELPLTLTKLSRFYIQNDAEKDIDTKDVVANPSLETFNYTQDNVSDTLVLDDSFSEHDNIQTMPGKDKRKKQKYFCFECGQRPFAFQQLELHLRCIHNKVLEGRGGPSHPFNIVNLNKVTMPNEGKPIMAKQLYICLVCNSELMTCKALRAHLLKKHNKPKSVDEKKYGGKVIKMNVSYYCTNCNFETTCQLSCQDHVAKCFASKIKGNKEAKAIEQNQLDSIRETVQVLNPRREHEEPSKGKNKSIINLLPSKNRTENLLHLSVVNDPSSTEGNMNPSFNSISTVHAQNSHKPLPSIHQNMHVNNDPTPFSYSKQSNSNENNASSVLTNPSPLKNDAIGYAQLPQSHRQPANSMGMLRHNQIIEKSNQQSSTLNNSNSINGINVQNSHKTLSLVNKKTYANPDPTPFSIAKPSNAKSQIFASSVLTNSSSLQNDPCGHSQSLQPDMYQCTNPIESMGMQRYNQITDAARKKKKMNHS